MFSTTTTINQTIKKWFPRKPFGTAKDEIVEGWRIDENKNCKCFYPVISSRQANWSNTTPTELNLFPSKLQVTEVRKFEMNLLYLLLHISNLKLCNFYIRCGYSCEWLAQLISCKNNVFFERILLGSRRLTSNIELYTLLLYVLIST